MSDREEEIASESSPAAWSTVLALLVAAASAGCDPGDSPLTREPGHPCFGQSGCSLFRQLPDGAPAPLPPQGDAGRDDAAVAPSELRVCGACNG